MKKNNQYVYEMCIPVGLGCRTMSAAEEPEKCEKSYMHIRCLSVRIEYSIRIVLRACRVVIMPCAGVCTVQYIDRAALRRALKCEEPGTRQK